MGYGEDLIALVILATISYSEEFRDLLRRRSRAVATPEVVRVSFPEFPRERLQYSSQSGWIEERERDSMDNIFVYRS